MSIQPMVEKLPYWLKEEGEYSEIVISTRVRLARNLSDTPFVQKANDEELSEVMERAREAFLRMERFENFFYMDVLEHIEKQFLIERRLTSPEFAKNGKNRGLAVGEDEKFGIMVNEEDHFRIFSIVPGFSPEEAYEVVDDVDNFLSRELDIAFDGDFGYLTACPTNVGTGMRISVLVHLPALVLTKEIDKVIRSLSQTGYFVRGLWGEGSRIQGNIFQISNQKTLGIKEEEIIENIRRVVKEVMDYELNAREILIKNARSQIEDKIWRAWGILKYARMLSSEEVINLSSAVRLGIGLGFITNISVLHLTRLLVLSLPAHLQLLVGREMEVEERDIKRAEFVRKTLGGKNDG